MTEIKKATISIQRRGLPQGAKVEFVHEEGWGRALEVVICPNNRGTCSLLGHETISWQGRCSGIWLKEVKGGTVWGSTGLCNRRR